MSAPTHTKLKILSIVHCRLYSTRRHLSGPHLLNPGGQDTWNGAPSPSSPTSTIVNFFFPHLLSPPITVHYNTASSSLFGGSALREDYEDYEETGIGQPADTSALPTGDNHTSQPERDLQPGDPKLVGGAPSDPKKGMADKVKGMFHGMKGHKDADVDSAIGSGVGQNPQSSPYGIGATDPDYTGRSMDPTGAPAGTAFDPNQGGDRRDADDDVSANAATQEATNDQGALTDHQGNLTSKTAQDAVKREGIISKIKDKIHGNK